MSRASTFPLLLVASLIAVAATPVVAAAFETVSIPAGEFALKAEVLRPAGAGPFPVMVGLRRAGQSSRNG